MENHKLTFAGMLTFALAASLCASLLSPRAGAARRPHPSAQEKPAPVRERFQNAEVIYDWVSNKRGDKLRTFITRPKNSAGKVPAIFFVGWLSCDSMEYAKGETDGFGALMLRLIEQSGYATARMDKPGVGESSGNCAQADFQSELEKNPTAKDFFATLNSQNRFAILFRIQTAKKPETRSARIQKFIDMLTRHEKIYP